MTDSKTPILRMSRATFNDWLRSGVWPLPLAESATTDDDVIVQLLPKYAQFVASGRPVAALIDEVVAVAQLTPELTSNLGMWLQNLGEPWLPVRFFAFENRESSVTHQTALVEPLAPEPISGVAADSEPEPEAAPMLTPVAVKEAGSSYAGEAEPMPTEQTTSKKRNGARSRSKTTKKAKTSAPVEDAANQSQLFATTESGSEENGVKG